MGLGKVRVGISGWRYARWRGDFYPEGLPQRNELEYAAERFSSVEINGTFYSLQAPASFKRWADQTPKGFVFSVKGPRFITHMKRLKDVRVPLANFFASGVLSLGPKLGPLLWQLPPSFSFDQERLKEFFAMLPRTVSQASSLGRHHDRSLKHRAVLPEGGGRIRHALEIRHDSFRDPRFIALLRRQRIALVVADTVEWPLLMDVTADFVYVRLHGSRQLYASGYGSKALAQWAMRVRDWTVGREADGDHAGPAARPGKRDVFVYFDNDAKVHAPFDAQALIRRLREPITRGQAHKGAIKC